MTLRSTRFAAIGVGAVLLTAAFTGCGGSDSSDDSGALSKDDFIAQANEICAGFNTTSDEAEKEFNAAIQENDLEAAGDAFAANTERMTASIDEFEALTPPAEDQEKIDEFIDLSRQQAEIGAQVADAIRSGDQKAIQEVSAEGSELDAQSDAIADEYGLTDCGSAGDDA